MKELTYLNLVLLRFLPRTSTSCATGQRWSTWEALTTMQHNHSHRAAPPTGQTSQERAKCPISATIHSLDSLWKRDPAPFSDPPSPPGTGERGGGRGGREGQTQEKEKRDTRFSRPRQRPPPIAEIDADTSDDTMRFFFLFVCWFCFKHEMKTTREQDSDSDKHDDRCTDATTQSGSSASLLRPAKTSPIVKGYW